MQRDYDGRKNARPQQRTGRRLRPAAATAVAVSVTSMPSQSYTIRLDKPFIYVIYETTTNAIVFMGRVVNP